MKLLGMMLARNSAWVLGLSARVALQWVDELVILEHASTDHTQMLITELQAEYRNRVWRLTRNDPEWKEMQDRQSMLDAARRRAASHLAIIDDDEILTANLTGNIRNLIEAQSGAVLQVPGYNLRGSMQRYHANGLWGTRWFSLAFEDQPGLGWRSRSGYDHHHREPFYVDEAAPRRPPQIRERSIPHGSAGIMHLWGASERRLRAKHAWYQVMETLKYPETPRRDILKQYTQAIERRGNDPVWEYADVPARWTDGYEKWKGFLDLDGEPWQERAVREAVREHGAARFAGLDLLGVA